MNAETEILSVNYNIPPLYGWNPMCTQFIVHHCLSKKKRRDLKRAKRNQEKNKKISLAFSSKRLLKIKLISSDDSGDETLDTKKINILIYCID